MTLAGGLIERVTRLQQGVVVTSVTRCAGTAKRSALWRCSWLYQCTKPAAHWRAASRLVKPPAGISGAANLQLVA